MLSSVDKAVSPRNVVERQSVSITKARIVSTGVTISRLKSGRFAISAHDGNRRVIVELSDAEAQHFARELQALVEHGDPTN